MAKVYACDKCHTTKKPIYNLILSLKKKDNSRTLIQKKIGDYCEACGKSYIEKQ